MTEADFMTAIYGYIVSVTGIDGKRVFRGNQSRMVLPKSGEYCIYTPIIRQRRGTNVYSFDATNKPDTQNGIDSITALVMIDVQVDFYDATAQMNAQALEIASHSYIGTDYFKQNNYDCRVCSSGVCQNLTGIDASNQYEERWSLTLTVEVNSTTQHSLPWFEDVQFRHKQPDGTYKDGIINVDIDMPTE